MSTNTINVSVTEAYNELMTKLAKQAFWGEIFIVPNSLAKLDQFFGSIKSQYQRLCDAETAYQEFSELHDWLVQVWTIMPVAKNENGSKMFPGLNFDEEVENFEDHEGFLELSGGWTAAISHRQSYIPVRCFDGLREGDSVALKYPLKIHLWNETTGEHKTFWSEDVSIPVVVRLTQTKYRYRQYGSFEECLGKLLARAELEEKK